MTKRIKAVRKTAVARLSVGDEIIRGLREAIAFQRGDRRDSVVRRVTLTSREASASPAPQYDAGQVKTIRSKLGFSQAVFGAALNVSPETVRAWEQGKKQPGGPAERLLEIADKHPSVINAVIQSRGIVEAKWEK